MEMEMEMEMGEVMAYREILLHVTTTKSQDCGFLMFILVFEFYFHLMLVLLFISRKHDAQYGRFLPK
jgi:hypothetical protein